VALIGTPAGFALVAPDVAGRLAGRMLQQEAYLSLALSVLLIVAVRRLARTSVQRTGHSLFSTNLVLVLGALFCTVFGYFAVQPMMAAARAGQGALSFGALHGISMGLFGLRAVLVTGLAWRLTAR
jgi:hypothetical protein